MTQQDRQCPLKIHVLPLTALVTFLLSSLIPVYPEAMGASDLSGPASHGLIAYTLRDSAGRLQIVTAYADGSNRRQRTSVGDNGRPDWSPDGARIVLSARRGKRVFVAVMDADGGIPIPEYMRTWGRWGGPVEDKPLSELGLENGEYI